MADTFKPYQGGIAPIQGISEAGARIGSMTQEGLMSFGKSLAEGIKGYQDNTQKRQVVDEQSKALGMQLQRYHQMFSQTDEQGNLINPEYAGLAEGLKSQIESLSKVPSLSLGSALGAVNAAQAAFQGLDKEIAVNEMMRKASLEKGIYTAEQGAPDKEKYDVAALMQSGKWGYNPNESYAKNETNLREAIRTAKAADPTVKGDENEAVAKWRNQVQGLAAGIQDEQQKAIIIDELEAARQLERRQKEVVSEFEKSGLAAGVMKFAGMYGEDLTRDMSLTTETTQALLDAKNKPAETAVEIPAKQESTKGDAKEKLIETLAPIKADVDVIEKTGIDQRIAYLRYLKEQGFERDDANPLGVALLRNISNIEATYRHLIPNNDVSKMNLAERLGGVFLKDGKELSKEHSEAIRTALNKNNNTVQADVNEILDASGISNRLLETLKELPNLGFGRRLTSEQRVAGIAAVDKKIAELETLKKQPTPTIEERKTEIRQKLENKSTEPAKPLGTLVGTENLQFGTKEETRDIPIAQKRAQVAEYFKTKFGYVPSGFNEVYAKIHPESVLQTTQVNGTTLLWDGQKWTQMQGEKQLTVDEKLKMRERQFGALDKEGKPVKTEIIPNSGIYAYGTFNSSSAKRVGDFRQYVSDVSQVNYALNKLTEINQRFGSSTSPAARQAAEQWKTRLRAIIKPEVANTGSVSDFEQRKMETVIPAVAEFLSLQDTNQTAIDILREKMNMNVTATGAAFGVDIEIRTGANSKEAVIKQAKLNKHRNKQ